MAGKVGIPALRFRVGPGSLTGIYYPCAMLCWVPPPDMWGHLCPLPRAGFGEAAGEDVEVFTAE